MQKLVTENEIAISKAKEFKPDLIISDVVMPKKTDLKFAES